MIACPDERLAIYFVDAVAQTQPKNELTLYLVRLLKLMHFRV